jgi:hypothetical protein
MNSAPLAYWEPGSEERQLRVFISHRYGDDSALYAEVIQAVERNGFSVQDISLSAEQYMAGPRGGKLSRLEVQAGVAARIYTCDLLIAPSRPAVSRSEWVTWEVQIAAVGYGVPILFVNQKRDQQRKTALVAQVEELGLPHRVCNRETSEIARNVAELVSARPTWAMRQGETDQHLRFRGPPLKARDEVLKRFPFQPRLATPDAPPPPAKRTLWQMLAGRDHHA